VNDGITSQTSINHPSFFFQAVVFVFVVVPSLFISSLDPSIHSSIHPFHPSHCLLLPVTRPTNNPFIMGGPILTKKQKAQMKERRKKMVAVLKEHGAPIPDHLDTSYPAKKRKRVVEDTPVGPKVVVIPGDLEPKDVKKLRKDARRKAKQEGIDENLITFVKEGEPTIPNETKRDNKPPPSKKPKKTFPRINEILAQQKEAIAKQQLEQARLGADASLPDEYKSKYVALDCEMVGIGTDGKQSALARVSLTNWDGGVILDTFVQVPARVTDFRTHVSGVTARDIHTNRGAMEVGECRKTVSKLLKDKILVGHALHNDLQALLLQHPKENLRDTAKYRPFQRLGGTKWRPRKLRDLVMENLGIAIQVEGEAHDSTIDARSTMEVFKRVREVWEKDLAQKDKKKSKKGASRK
jgi:RNA exonuclease 4